MEKELDPDVIKATQNSLGKYVKRPPLSDKLLKKPPFRFIHDIVTTVLKTTGFFEGLFEENELVSDNVKDREAKALFLNKVIYVIGTTTGKPLAVKSSKIIAGQEPDKTNELLQCLAQALDRKLSSNEAVKKYKAGEKHQVETKTKEVSKTVKPAKPNEVKKLTSRSSEKLTSKRDTSERSLTRNDKEKATVKTKQKETAPTKKESPPKKTTTQSKSLAKKNSIEKQPQKQNETKLKRNSLISNSSQEEDAFGDVIKNTANSVNTDQDSGVALENQDINEPASLPKMSQNDPEDHGKLNASFTIAENELNSSLSSQDLMEVNDSDENHQENVQNESESLVHKEEEHKEIQNAVERKAHTQNDFNKEKDEESHKLPSNPNSGPQSHTKDTDILKFDKIENLQDVIRPKSVRPSSSRPGAPRLRDKHDNIITGNENLIVGKINIIAENAPQEEEEDNSIIIVDQQVETPTISKDQDLQLSSNEHGALVQQILDSQKEFTQSSGKTEIEWQFAAQKAREAVNQEIEQLRFNVQALSRVANPLGKVLDHIQEDVEVMRQELQQWTKTYEDASKELVKQKTANEDSLFPLHTKLKQLDEDIKEKRYKINDLKMMIYKNSSRIEKLLAGGDVQ